MNQIQAFLYTFNDLISNIDFDKYYDFTVFKNQNNDQIIIYITYFDSFKIYISSIIKAKDNSKSLEEYKYNESLNTFGQSISCKFVFDNLYNLCFFIDESNLLVASLINPIHKNISIQSSAEGMKLLRYIKSTYIKKMQQIFICGTDYNDLISCIIYDIRKNKFNEWIDLEETLEEQLPEKIQTYYFKETENIIFFISYDDYAISYSIDEKGELIKSGKCDFSHLNFIFLFLSCDSNKNYELISDLSDNIICNINSTIIPNITIESSSINSNINLNKSTIFSIPTSFILSTAYNYLYSTYQYSQTSLLSSSNILISKESSLIKSTSYSSTSFLIDKSSTNLHYSTQLITSSTLPITFNNHSSLLIYTSQAINSNSKISDKINSFPIIYTSDLTIDISSIPKIEIIEEEIIITEKINITKENLIDEIPFIIKNVEVGKIYNKIGEDYNILIYPTNSTFLSSITHVNFSECETLLRNHYEIPDSTIITFLQLELENENSQSLINQVEYEAYIENKTHLDLSLCNNTNIHVIYAIKNKSLIDFSIANSFKNSGIDIFNINDSFFNDICQPYSESDNDMILEDRIKDIYQNYSLCEIGCNYNKIDLENMTISCKCKIKDNISLVITPLNLEKTEGSSTNFEVIKCYKLVFSLKGKLKNFGFLIFLLLIIIHIPFLFYYFSIGIRRIKIYIIEEMKKYGYIKDKKNKNNNFKRKKRNSKTMKSKIVHTKIIRNNKKKNKTKLSIKKIRVINNSSLINIMKSSDREITSDKNNDKSTKINNIIGQRKSIKNNKKKTIKMKKKHKNSKLNLIKVNKNLNKKNFSHITTANISEDGVKNNNANKFSLINIDLNLYRHKQYIPPNSHIILDNYTFQEAIKFDLRELCEIFYIFALSKQILFHTFYIFLL